MPKLRSDLPFSHLTWESLETEEPLSPKVSGRVPALQRREARQAVPTHCQLSSSPDVNVSSVSSLDLINAH